MPQHERSIIWLLGACLTLGACQSEPAGQVAPPSPTAGSVAQATAESTPAAQRQRTVLGGQFPVKMAWWNQEEAAKDLGLTAEQRAKMDRVLLDRRERNRTLVKERQEKLSEFLAALQKGDWDAAARARAEVRAALAAGFDVQSEVKLEVMKLLTAEQRTTLGTKHGKVMRQPWLQALPVGGGFVQQLMRRRQEQSEE